MLLLSLACAVPEPACPLWYSDLDGDGFGGGEGVASCAPLVGRSEVEGDCDDRDSSVHPGAIDPALDGVDQDCDGEDTCAAARAVDSIKDVDCERGTFVFNGEVNRWPVGDCICAAESVVLSGEEANKLNGGLVEVTWRLQLGSEDAPWDGSGLEGLQQVGYANLVLEGEAELPALRQAADLSVQATQPSVLRLPALVDLEKGRLSGPVHGEMDILEHVLSLDLAEQTAAGQGPGQPTLELPALRSASYIQAGPETLLYPALLTSLGQLNVYGEFEAPKLSVLHILYLMDEGVIKLPLLRECSSIHIFSDTPAADRTLPELLWAHQVWVDGAGVALPKLSSLERLVVYDGQVSAPLIQALERIDTSGQASLELPNLSSVEQISAYAGHTQFSAPERLVHVDDLYVSAEISLPELTRLDWLVVREGADANLPKLSYITTLYTEGFASLPSLRSTETLKVEGEPPSLPALQSINEAVLSSCPELPSLRYLRGPMEAHCAVDLRGVSSFPDPLELSLGEDGKALLPDPYTGAVWLRSTSEPGTLQLDQIQGALSIAHEGEQAASVDTEVLEISGQLHLALYYATSLGGLQQVESIGKDLTYCMPLVPDSEIQAWLTTLYVGGEIINRCP